MKVKFIVAVSILMTSAWMLEAKRSTSQTAAAQPAASSTTTATTQPTRACPQGQVMYNGNCVSTSSATTAAKNFNGMLTNGTEQTVTAQFFNVSNQLLATQSITKNASVTMPAGTIKGYILLNNQSVTDFVVHDSDTTPTDKTRDYSYIITYRHGQWKVGQDRKIPQAQEKISNAQQ